MRVRSRLVVLVSGSVVLAGALVPGATASAASASAAQPPAAVVDEVAKALDLSPEQARTRLAQQAEARMLARSLPTEVRQASAGQWFDEATGSLAVAVTDEATADEVRAVGARPEFVQYDRAELERRLAKVTELAGTGVPGVTGWGIDPEANAVAVTVDRTARTAETDRFLAALDGVRVHETTSSPRQQGGDVRPGNPWWPGGESNCSIGFAATDSGGGKHFVTAGHCTNDADQAAYGGSGQQNRIGTSNVGGSRSVNAREGDMGVVAVTEPGWNLSASVNTWGEPAVTVAGVGEALVNEAVCHSGNTSKWECGEVTAVDQTVDYGNVVIEGLSFTTACSLGGDSGGAWLAGDEAVGLHSGGQSSCEPGGARDQSIFQPVAEALAKWDLTLVTGEGDPGDPPGNERTFTSTQEHPIEDYRVAVSPLRSTASGAAASPATVTVTAEHTCRADLNITVVSPSGRWYPLQRYGGYPCTQLSGTESFSLTPRGEQAEGTWTLRIGDNGPRDTGLLKGWSISL